jgi:DNA-binding beta-propeller fold protein YncE
MLGRKEPSRWAVGLLTLALLLVLSGCASAPSQPRLPVGAELNWPPPPAEARIIWTGEISQPADLGIGKGFWTWLVELVVGEDNTRIVRPYGVYADGEGRIYVTDPGGALVHCYDTKRGRYTRLKGAQGSPLKAPIGVSGDGRGTVYVTDAESGVVLRKSPDDDELLPFITKGLQRPTGLAVDPQGGRLYLADSILDQIVVFDLAGQEKFRFGAHGEAPGKFNHPTDLWLDRQGRLLVTDPLNFRVQIFSRGGMYLSSITKEAGDAAGNFSKPKGVAVDSDGHIYLADALLDAIQIFDEQGRLLLVFGDKGSQSGEFWMPAGIFIGADDMIYVADVYNFRIQTFRYRRAAGSGADRLK